MGRILEVDGEAFKVNFMRIILGINAFIFLEKLDIAWIEKSHTTRVESIRLVTTSHQNCKLSFTIDLFD